MRKIKVIADDKIPFLKGALEGRAEIAYLPGNKITAADLNDADALLIRTRTQCNELLLKGTPVKFIATATIGYDHIDTEFCRRNDIFWTNAPGCNSSSVEQYIVSALLTLALKQNLKLSEKTMGIIGVGNVGSKVARAAKILGIRVLLNDPPRAIAEGLDGFESLEKISREADIISFHVPLNYEGAYKTAGMANSDFFSGLKKNAILINSSRGEVINESDLQAAVNAGKIGSLVLDVWNNEPNINVRLMEAATLVSPHIAGYSTDGKANGTSMSIKALSNYFNLGLGDWSPENIPLPQNQQIIADCTGKTEIEILHEVYTQTYDITTDDETLRENPDGFESQRGGYRIRREPHAFSVKLLNNSWPGLEEKFEKLGFSVLAPNCFCEI